MEQHEFEEEGEVEQPAAQIVTELEDEIARRIDLLEEKKQNLIEQHQGECQQLEEYLAREYQTLEAKLLKMQVEKMEELNRKREEVFLPPARHRAHSPLGPRLLDVLMDFRGVDDAIEAMLMALENIV